MINVNIAVLLPLLYGTGTRLSPGNLTRLGADFVCTLTLALEHVNARNSSVVPQLASLSTNFPMMSADIFNTDDNDGAGRPAKAVKSLLEYFYTLRDPRHVSAVLGPTYSSVAKPTALIASAEQVPMLSYFASSRDLSNNLTYPFFTRTYPTDDTAARLLTRALYDGSVFTDWNHVAVVYRDDAFGQGYLGAMQDEFDDWINSTGHSTSQLGNNFKAEDVDTYHTLRSFAFTDEKRESIEVALELVKRSGYSIIVLIGASQSLAILLEVAEGLSLVTSKHAWFIVEGSVARQTIEDDEKDGSLIGMQTFEVLTEEQEQPGLARFLQAWQSMVPAKCDNSFFTPDEKFFDTSPISAAVYLYDGVAAIALAADAALKAQGAHEVGGEALLKALLTFKFDGASGRVAFDENGDRDGATIRFALGSLAPSTTNITYIIDDDGKSKRSAMQWIGGDSKQPPDAYRSELIEEAKRRKAEQQRMIIGTVVGVLVSIVATLCATFWWVRVRRVAKRYKVSPWQLIRGEASAKARVVHFVFVKMHRRWVRLSSARAVRHRVTLDDDDARDVRGNALLVAAGWRSGAHAPLSIWTLRDQLTGAGRATAGVEVTAVEVTDVQVEVPAHPNPSGNVGGRTGISGRSGDDSSRHTSSTAGGGGESSRESAFSRRSSVWGGSGDNVFNRTNRRSSIMNLARVEVAADPVTRRLLTACNTDWRVQPKAIDVCKAPTAMQVHANLLDLEFDLPHFCSLFKEYAEAEAMSDGESLPGSSDGNGGVSDGESRMFPELRMTEEGWLRFQRVDQDEHNTVEQLKLFRAATRTLVRPNADSSSSADLTDGGGGGSLTFVEFVKLLLSPANRALDPAALLPEEGHADAPLSHFWIATSHNSYAVGHQLTGYADEAMYRRLLLQGCRSLEIDCWNGRRGEPVVTHGNTLVNKISFASVAKAVRETAFITSQAPVILSLEMHCGAKQQARIAELLKKELGALLLTADELEGLFEAQSTAAREIDGRGESARISARRLARHVGEHPSERELPLKALQGRVLVKSKVVPQRPRYEERSSTDDDDPQSPQTPQSGTKRGSKGVVDPNLSALITMVSIPAPRFMRGSLPSGVQGLPISSVSEPLLLSIFATAGEDLRAEAAAKVQRVTRGWQARGFPRGTRIKSDNADPLFQWGMGVQQVALNLQTNDTPTQLHHALFALGGGCGYVLKPREMRAEPPEAWPPARAALHRATITLLSLHQLPAPDEDRPALASGHRSACHKCVPELSGEYTGPSVSSVSSPAVSIELHPIGGYCRVSTALPPPPVAGLSHTTQAVERSGFNACFGGELPVHCLAAEPRETLLRVGVWDHGTLVAYDTLVLGALRAGYRCIQLRSRLGTRLELCHLFVHVALGEEENTNASVAELRDQLQQLRDQQQTFAQEQELLVQGLHGELDSLRQRVKLAEGASP